MSPQTGQPHHLGSFYARQGPHQGLLAYRDDLPTLDVYDAPGSDGDPIGVAHPVGWMPDLKGPAAAFRLVVGGVEVEGRWVCWDREFIPIGEAQLANLRSGARRTGGPDGDDVGDAPSAGTLQ